ncbi:hypothetical protein CLOM_g19054, partial [Closterium sp. NIES-68]
LSHALPALLALNPNSSARNRYRSHVVPRATNGNVAGQSARGEVDSIRKEISDLITSIQWLQKKINSDGRQMANGNGNVSGDGNGGVTEQQALYGSNLRPATEIRGRIERLLERAVSLKSMAGRNSSSTRRVPVQVTATLKSLQREYGSLYNIVRLSIRTDLPDMPPSALFDEPADAAAAEAAAGGLEEGIEAAGRPLDAALAFSSSPSFDTQRESAAALGSMLEIQQRVQQQISAMSAAGSLHAGSPHGPHSPSTAPPAHLKPPNSSTRSSQPAIPAATAATAAAAAAAAAAGSGSPFASLWKNMASQLSRAFETLLPPPSPDDALAGGAGIADRTAAGTASGTAGNVGIAGAAGAAGAVAGIGGGAVGGVVVGDSGMGAAEGVGGGGPSGSSGGVIDITPQAPLAGAQSSLVRLAGEVRSEDALISSVNREMEDERQRLLSKVQTVAQEVQQRVTVGDMEAVVGAAVETMQSELQAAQQRTRQLLIQVELKDREMRLRREEWEKERSSMVASLQQLVLAKGGSINSSSAGSSGGSSGSGGPSSGQSSNGRAIPMPSSSSSSASSSSPSASHSKAQRSSGSATATATATPEPDTTGDSIMRLLALQAAVSRAEEAELATAARLERVADVLGREIAKLRRDKRALESRAQLLTWRLEAVHVKLAGVFAELVGVREAMSEGRVEEGMVLLEGVIGEVGRWTSTTSVEQGEGGGEWGERVGMDGGKRREGEVVAGWWDDSPPGEWAEFGKSENEESGSGTDEERRREEGRRRDELMALVEVDGEGEEGVITVFYETGWEQAFIHHSGTPSGWTAVPGIRMKDTNASGPAGFPLKVYSIRASSLEFVTNNGAATWDSSPTGGNYTIDRPGCFVLSSGRLSEFR